MQARVIMMASALTLLAPAAIAVPTPGTGLEVHTTAASPPMGDTSRATRAWNHESTMGLHVQTAASPPIGDGAERVCKWYGLGEGEYCCPHTKRCLKPVRGKTCGGANVTAACGRGETCCPLTRLCVTVHTPCVPPPHCPADSYCCPDAHRCMAPSNPGTLCRNKGDCPSDNICCPTSHECVTVGGECTPPMEEKPAWIVEAERNMKAADHSTVYIIRHGEKTWSGGCLNPPGQERANHLPRVFKFPQFETPTALFADQYLDGVDCERCWSTIEPTAQHLNISMRFDHGHKMNGGNSAAAAAIRKASLTNPVILVGWEHVNIQYLTAALGVNPSAIPHWKGSDYDTVYVLKLDGEGKLISFEVKAQNYKPCSTPTAYKPCEEEA